jgi:hypothetical protein
MSLIRNPRRRKKCGKESYERNEGISKMNISTKPVVNEFENKTSLSQTLSPAGFVAAKRAQFNAAFRSIHKQLGKVSPCSPVRVERL